MSDFYTRKPVPIWRISLYGVLAAAGVATIGYIQHDGRLYLMAIIAGAFIGGFGFWLSWTRANVKPVSGGSGQPARYPKWVYWMFYGGLAVSAALKVWDLARK